MDKRQALIAAAMLPMVMENMPFGVREKTQKENRAQEESKRRIDKAQEKRERKQARNRALDINKAL